MNHTKWRFSLRITLATALLLLGLLFSNPLSALSRSVLADQPNTATNAASVYVLRGDNEASDTAVIEALQEAGFAVTSGVTTPAWDGTQANLQAYDVVVILYNQNWSSSLNVEGMRAINRYLRSGGGLVTGEWFIWRGSSELTEFLPARNCGWNSGTTTTYSRATPDPLINAGLPASFSFDLGNFSGRESCFEAMPNATVFYSSSNGGGRADAPGLVGWTLQLGRVASFSTLLSATELADNNYRRLFTNTVTWVSQATRAELFVRKGVSRATAQTGEQLQYTIQLNNISAEALQITSVSDQLPPGFSYLPGSTVGLTTQNPQVTTDSDTGTQTLTWTQELTLPVTSSISMTFGVQIGNNVAVDTYFNSATATAMRNGEAVGVLSAINVAPVRVSLATGLGIKIGDEIISLPPDTTVIPVVRGRGLTLNMSIQCPAPFNPTPEAVNLLHDGRSYAMSEEPEGSGRYTGSIPAGQVTNSPLTLEILCRDPNDPGAEPTELPNPLPSPRLYDPSGDITNARTGAPVAAATVTLYRVPGARPDTESETRDCRIIPTRPEGDLEPWDGLPDHVPGANDERMNTSLQPAEIDPPVNPQITNEQGRYGWDVVEGCWYVVVEAPGYLPRTSPLVGVPPEVLDLDLRLTPMGDMVFLPLVRR